MPIFKGPIGSIVPQSPNRAYPVWLIACCALGCASALLTVLCRLGVLPAASLVFKGAAPWRWPLTIWSAPLLGVTPTHTLANILALLALGLLGAAVEARSRQTLALLICWPLTTLSLALCPAIEWYMGLSGLIHAGAAILALHALTQRPTRLIGFALLAGLAFKLGVERSWITPVGYDLNWGFNVTYAAHSIGVGVAAILWILIEAVHWASSYPAWHRDAQGCGERTT